MKFNKNTIAYLSALSVDVAFTIAITGLFVESNGEQSMAFVGAIIGAVGSAVGGVLGSIRAAKQRKELNNQQRQLDRWYNGEMGTSYLDRADSRSMLKRIRDYYDERMRKQDTQNIKGGASEEAKVAQAVAANKGIADAASRISAAGQQHKDSVANQYKQLSYNLGVQKAGLAGGGAQSLANAMSSASGVLGDIVNDARGNNRVSRMAKKVREGGNHGISPQATDSILDSLDKRLQQ